MTPGALVSMVAGSTASLVRWPSVVWQAVHLGGGGVLLIVLWLVLARWWGPEAFGQFNYLFAYAAVCGLCCDFGLDVLLTRRVARSGPWTPRTFAAAKAGVVLGSLALFLVGGWVLGMPPAVVVLLLGVVLLSATNFADGIVRGMDRLDIEARIGIVQKLVFIGGSVAGVVVWGGGALWVALCYLFSHVVGVAATTRVTWVKDWLRLAQGEGSAARVLGGAWPLWAVALLTGLAVRVDLFFLQWLAGERAVGTYSAAARLIEGLVLLGMAYISAVFPRLVQAMDDRERIRWLIRRSMAVLIAGGAGIAIVGYFISPWLMETLFGVEYAASTGILRLLLPAVAVVYVTGFLGHTLVAVGWQRAYLVALVAAVIVNILVDYWAVPVWGAYGAVAGFWARELVLVALLLALVGRSGRWTA